MKTTEVYCKTPTELINAIASNTVIHLTEAEYNLTGIEMDYDEHLFFRDLETPDDDKELVLTNLHDLSLVGEHPDGVRIYTSYYWANVMCFERCQEVRLHNISFGHYPKFGGCTGGVILFDESSKIQLTSLTLFGCGIDGLQLTNSHSFTITDCIIRECNDRILFIEGSRDVAFVNCEFIDNEATMIELRHSNNISFESCIYRNNTPGGYGDVDDDGNVCYILTRNTNGTFSFVDFKLNNEIAQTANYSGPIKLTYLR